MYLKNSEFGAVCCKIPNFSFLGPQGMFCHSFFVFTFAHKCHRRKTHSISCRSFRIARLSVQGFPTKSSVVAVVTLASYRKATEGVKIGPLACL